ncbi:hypothetical protein TVD_06630 [Thioalkalivibrio versutus]|uniref:Uncharacterized protein n=1 Tax=Thioalkalivibrio versutus TaxID=106634 RepID=A0A0G3G1G9_9GAMM|nr:hypothetical protein [Thioalkalivibrio versutus]AKJ95055.1 hypothetical protein TVD_06630 [Thioalkalivibrio versutus]
MNGPDPISEATPATDWNREVSKRIQRLQTIERFCGHIAEGGVDDDQCLYWWAENEIRAARDFLDRLYREFGAREKGNPGSEQVLKEIDKRTLRLQAISEAASLLVDSNEVPAPVWFWISKETAAADELVGRLWQACREASGLKPVTV